MQVPSQFTPFEALIPGPRTGYSLSDPRVRPGLGSCDIQWISQWPKVEQLEPKVEPPHPPGI